VAADDQLAVNGATDAEAAYGNTVFVCLDVLIARCLFCHVVPPDAI